MKKMRRITALFLCILMMFPAQAITILADTEENPVVSTTETEPETESAGRLAETVKVGALDSSEEPIEETLDAETTAEERIDETLEIEAATEERIEETLKVEELERINEILPIEPLVVWNQDAMIYWNPGGELPAELASASNAAKASASNARKGRDSADGMSPERPVKTLARALEQAEKLKEELDVESSEITIYAMSPMEISDGQLYVMNGANIRIASWPGRSYDNDTIFYVNGGQLSLINTLLESGNQEDDPEQTQLITVHGGTLQLGQAVEIDGQITMDYRKVKETALWETASDSNTASRSNTEKNTADSGTAHFNIDEYILSTDEESTELIEDTTTASTWCKPLIELMDGYEDNSGEYLLTVNTDTTSNQLELVRTLCADELSGEEFLDYFTITYNDATGAEWNLTAATTEAATIRDTASADTALYRSLEQMLTTATSDEIISDSTVMSDETTMAASTKSLIATRAGGTVKYWNPGGDIVIAGETYQAGSDSGVDGNDPKAAYKTWEKAVASANGGTVVCMQSVILGSDIDYIKNGNPQGDGSYLIESTSRETMVTLTVWETQPQPIFIVPEDETLVLKNIELIGLDTSGASTQLVLCQSGDIVIDENVTVDKGYIQVDAFKDLASHPVTVNSTGAVDDGVITLFFGGINDNISYRFTDVVVPGTALAARVAADPDEVGQALLARVVLDTANRDALHGGQSKFDWTLRQDTDQDGDPLEVNPQNLELYTEYYYDAIYLDGERGDDDYYGATCQYPVKTWGKARAIWETEMARSIAARAQAKALGQDAAYIEANYPVPKVIYICGTVTVDAAAAAADCHWKLEPKTDYDNNIINTEVRSHVDIPYDDNGDLVHSLPKILVKIDSGGELVIEDVAIRNYTEEKDSITLQVNSGGKLILTGDTQLTGTRLEDTETLTARLDVTCGTHVQVTAGGNFVMDAGWSGAIECREHGVEGTGYGARITMNNGEICKNNSFDQALYDVKNISQLKGAGVVLSDAASFEMNGGKISNNTVYSHGAGVYLTGTGTSFTLNKGEISENKMAKDLVYYDVSNDYVHGYGIGIFADSGTAVTLGSSTSDITDTLVTRNVGYWADGIGVCANGTLNVGKAAISDNYSESTSYYTNVRKGLGLYVGSSATLTMDGAFVTGNYSSASQYGNAQGAGIYLATNTNGNEIKNSRIAGNIVGYEYSNSITYTAGGGIYLLGGKLDIQDSEIEGNQAYNGAGIMAYNTSTSKEMSLTISGTSIINNKAKYSKFSTTTGGCGGGIYACGYGTVTLGTDTKINENISNDIGGGMYLSSYSVNYPLKLTMTNAYVNGNTAYSSGAGIYAYYGTTIEATNVVFNENIAETGEGGAVYAYGYYTVNSTLQTNYGNQLYFTNVNITANKAVKGGGIYGYYYTDMYFKNVIITDKNMATSGDGGGIYGYYCAYMYFNKVYIKSNKAESGRGGGIYVDQNSRIYYYSGDIENNTALSGGGLYSRTGTSGATNTIRLLEVNIANNVATSGSGGGFYLPDGSYYLTDSKVINNTASDMGGGIYVSSSSANLHFAETQTGKSSLTGNEADKGGGIYSEGSVRLDINGVYQNTATTQGSNLYLCKGDNYIYSGEFKQPVSPISEVYNIYMNVTTSNTHSLIMDPQKVVIEQKTGNPDAIYLNTTNSFLSLLTEPPNNNYGEFPIDVNKDVFKEGSIVVKPAEKESGSITWVTTDSDEYATEIDETTGEKTYPAKCTDVSSYASYYSGGSLPRRTQLGGFDSNIVIVGEGIYLDGINGLDSNDGSSPDKAVQTFAEAKVKLKGRIEDTQAADKQKTNEDDKIGFSPFIYICGNVPVTSDETWELNYEDDLFLETNAYYRIAEGDAKADAQVRRFGSFVKEPMITVGGTSSNTTFTTGKIIINGMAEAVIYADQDSNSPIIQVMEQSQAILTGYSRIINNYYSGVDVYGSLILTGDENDENMQLMNHHGACVTMMSSNSSLEMKDYARMVSDGTVTKVGTRDLYGIHIKENNVKNVVMKDNSKISNLSTSGQLDYGIYISGSKAEVRMQDSSEIYTDSGFYVTGSYATVSLEDYAKITGSNYYGIYIGKGGGSYCTILMNRNSGARDGDSAQIVAPNGIYFDRGYGATIEMGKNALLTRAGSSSGKGISITVPSGSTTDVESTITMFDNSRITNYQHGFYFYIGGDYPVKIVMKDNAAVDQNQYGMYEASYTSDNYYYYGINRLELVMEGNSRISGNSKGGICLIGNKDFSSSSYHKIIMKDNAVIGGSTTYSSSVAASGNQYTGIYANSPINLEMSGSSKISGNGSKESGTTDFASTNAITLVPFQYSTAQSSYLRATGKAYITLKENASICDNKGGIYVQYLKNYKLNPCEITLDGSEGNPSIMNNTDAVYLMGTDQTIKLQGSAILGAGSTIVNGKKLALDCYGSIELDGRSQIGQIDDGVYEGLIYLHTPTLPITMTHTVDDPSREYLLWLEEGFLGGIVVQPDGSSEGLTDVTYPENQLSHFIKVGAEGMAADKALAAAAPNIILLGENNVYLSGDTTIADDANSGSSPSTPVKTFKRAKELLEGAGYYTTGANIIICGNTVTVWAGDDEWSFDSEGQVTNSQSGDTWKPVVIRYEKYTSGRLISASSNAGYADTVTFKNITIDGGSAQGITTTTYMSDILFVGKGTTVTLGEGAVLQNNTVETSGTSVSSQVGAGVTVYGSTLKIEGGTIQNMVRRDTTANNTGTSNIGSAIYCYSPTTTDRGTVIMTSGEIINNTVDMPNKPGAVRAGAVSVESTSTSYPAPVFEMSGGRIENNQVIVKSGYTTAYGAGLVSYNAKTTISGGIISGNKGVQGSAIYYYDTGGMGSMILSGGQITGNTTNEAGRKLEGEGNYSPVYVAGGDFQLSGGGTNIQNNIYLSSTENIIKISGNIYQTGRVYNLFLNQAASSSDTTKFQKGSAVVQPDGSWITDVTPYLSYFQVHSNPYILDIGKTSRTAGTVSGVKENQCLILMHAVFLDSEGGSDLNNGSNPDQAVETFAKAQAIGQAGIGSTDVNEYYVIYISGKATNKTDTENVWTLPEPAYMCRYTGFQIYNADGSENDEGFYEYHGYLIEPSYDLTLDGITVYGRRSIDTVTNNGESLVNIKDGIIVTVQKTGAVSTIFGRNNNQGEYYNANKILENLSTKGGAFHVEAGGELHFLGGSISDTSASYGSAIYLEADAADNTKFGHLYLQGSPSIAGAVYLSGTGSTTAAYLQPDASYIPATALDVVIGNDYDGRKVVEYTDGTVPGYTEKDYYNLEDSIKALYDVVTDNAVLKLKIRSYIYLDGRLGNDSEGDGKTPNTAFKTIKRVYEAIAEGNETEGTLVFVVNTVEFSSSTPKITLNNILIRNEDGTSRYEGSYRDDNGTSIGIKGQVYFKRYAQPDGYNSTEYPGYNRPTLKDTLFLVKSGGDLTLNGIYLDGHSQDSDGADKFLVAAGVKAESPLITVMNGGTLTCGLVDKSEFTEGAESGIDTATVFTNNVNNNQKSKIIDEIEGIEIIEGSSAGIELLGGDTTLTATPSDLVGSASGGKAVLTRTQFSNLSLGSNVISGGTDVYSFGDLHFSDLTFFSGSVYLEGFGSAATESNYETSHYLTVDLYGQPAQADFQVLMRDPYNGRTVVYYQPEGDNGPASGQEGRFRLEERVKEFFYLTKREGVPYVLELRVPPAVYIDGNKGNDDYNDEYAGSNPTYPVKTLRRAYELLKTRSGYTIYVVGPIQVTKEIYVTGTTYTDSQGTITLSNTDKVKITRYVKPDFVIEDPTNPSAADYDVPDYQGELMNVKEGMTASFGANVYFDGHSKPKISEEYPLEVRVRNGAESKAPLITVEDGAVLNLYSETTLQDNNNTFDPSTDATLKADGLLKDIYYGTGSVLYNSGTTIVDGAMFENNVTSVGADIYQDGTFTIKSAPENLADYSFYLTTVNTGTETDPVWGTDHIIQTYAAIPDGKTFDIDMDHAVKGRDVVKFLDTSAYDPDADAEYNHFILGSTVPEYLFLVEAANDPTVLELQNWEVLDVNVPSDIYLVINRSGSRESTTKLSSVQTEAAGTDLLTSPEYTIKNNGRYDVKVSVTAFENQTTAAGISHPEMTLVDTAADAIGETHLYLGIQGMDSGLTETSLKPYAEATVTASPAELGQLMAGTEGSFKFVGAVGTGFIDLYNDSTFPAEGLTREEVQKYIDGTSGTINARAKYAMKFKLEIAPPRRSSTDISTNP